MNTHCPKGGNFPILSKIREWKMLLIFEDLCLRSALSHVGAVVHKQLRQKAHDREASGSYIIKCSFSHLALKAL